MMISLFFVQTTCEEKDEEETILVGSRQLSGDHAGGIYVCCMGSRRRKYAVEITAVCELFVPIIFTHHRRRRRLPFNAIIDSDLRRT
jgi:hypothetical protein